MMNTTFKNIITFISVVGRILLITSTCFVSSECPSDDAGIVLHNEKLYTSLRSINESYDNLFIDWSNFDRCGNISITLSLSIGLPADLIQIYSSIYSIYSKCETNGTSYKIKSSFNIGILQVKIGLCRLLPIYLLNQGSYCSKGIYDLLIFIADPTNQGWQYSENIDTEYSKWSSFSLNQYETITSANDIKSSHYNLTKFKNYCLHLYENSWSHDDDWFFVSPNLNQNLHYLFSLPEVQLDSMLYNDHITGSQLLLSQGFHINYGSVSLMFGFILQYAENIYYRGMGYNFMLGFGASTGFYSTSGVRSVYKGETFGFHDIERHINKSFVREDSDCGSLSFGDCGVGIYQSYCKAKGASAKFFCPSIPVCNVTCILMSPSLVINETNKSSISVYWSPFIKNGFSNISYKLHCCYVSSFNTLNICTNTDVGSSTNYVFRDLSPDTIYNINLEVVSLVPAVSISSTITAKTKREYDQLKAIIYGNLKGNMLNLSLEMTGYGYNVTVEYFLPSFVSFASDSGSLDFIENEFYHHKYTFFGSFFSSRKINHSISMKLSKRKCAQLGIILFYIPVKLSYENIAGIPEMLTKVYKNSLPCVQATLKISRDILSLPEYYGRGMYWDAENSYIYICMNQHIDSTRSACYYSSDAGFLWTDMDARVGYVLGHHSVTKTFYAIHRNQKTYLYFHSNLKKWLSLTNQQFMKVSSTNFTSKTSKSLEGDDEQTYTFGVNQWMGNADGLFYRNDPTSNWLPRIKWLF